MSHASKWDSDAHLSCIPGVIVTNPWAIGWESRVLDRVRRMGFADPVAFAAAHPQIPFGQLFRILLENDTDGGETITISQFQELLFEEAKRSGKLRHAIRDTLLRRLRQHLGHGWNRGAKIKERRAAAFSQWELPTFDRQRLANITDRIWQALRDLEPPDDWCPGCITNPYLEKAFEVGWPNDLPCGESTD
jgi:hypothetical protein